MQTVVPGRRGAEKSSLNFWPSEACLQVVKVRRIAWLSGRSIF